MAEEVVFKAINEIKNATEDNLKKVIEQHFEAVRTQGMKIGVQFIAAAIMGKIQKHLNKPGKTSLRDHERCIAEIKEVLAVQLTRQNDLTKAESTEDDINDGTAE